MAWVLVAVEVLKAVLVTLAWASPGRGLERR